MIAEVATKESIVVVFVLGLMGLCLSLSFTAVQKQIDDAKREILKAIAEKK